MSGLSLFALATLALAAGCSSVASTKGDGQYAIHGTVRTVDMTPTYSDGNGLVTIETADGQSLTISIPVRMGPREEEPNRCGTDALSLGFELQPGEHVEVRGEADGSIIYLCRDPEDFLRRSE